MSRLHSFAPKAWGSVSRANLDKQIEKIHALIGGKLPKSLLKFLMQFKGASVIFGKDIAFRPLVPSPWWRREVGRHVVAVASMPWGPEGQRRRCDGRRAARVGAGDPATAKRWKGLYPGTVHATCTSVTELDSTVPL